MKLFSIISALWLATALPFSTHAQEKPTPAPAAEKQEPGKSAEKDEDDLPPQVKSLIASLRFQKGEITLLGGKAKITLAPGYVYLDGNDSRKVLVDLFRNPPEVATSALGMIFPEGASPLEHLQNWSAVIEWSDVGYVKDEEYSSLNFDDMLKELIAGSKEASKKRIEQGYGKLEIAGWAQPPHYDRATHKLYWAKALNTESPVQSLNYDIRILGRSGVLEVSILSDLPSLKEIEKAAPTILSMIDFSEGNRYADYKDGDKVAAYGIGGLIAGGVLAKSGFLKVLMVAFAKFGKLIIIGLVALGAGVMRFIKGRPAKRLGE